MIAAACERSACDGICTSTGTVAAVASSLMTHASALLASRRRCGERDGRVRCGGTNQRCGDKDTKEHGMAHAKVLNGRRWKRCELLRALSVAHITGRVVAKVGRAG